MPVLAGTIPCPTCNNRPTVIRHTPNFEKLYKLENPWFLEVGLLFILGLLLKNEVQRLQTEVESMLHHWQRASVHAEPFICHA